MITNVYYSCSNIHKAFRRLNPPGASGAPRYARRCQHLVMPLSLDTNYQHVGSTHVPACWRHCQDLGRTYRILCSTIAMESLGQLFRSNPVAVVFLVLSSYALQKYLAARRRLGQELISHQRAHPVWKVVSRLCTTARSTTKTGAHCVRQRQLCDMPEGKFASVSRRVNSFFRPKPKEP